MLGCYDDIIRLNNYNILIYDSYYLECMVDLWFVIIDLLQDFELPIRRQMACVVSNILDPRSSYSKNAIGKATTTKISFVSSYCLTKCFDYLTIHFDNVYLIKKLFENIFSPKIWHLNWLSKMLSKKKQEKEKEKEKEESFQLFLPERPNDGFEPLLTVKKSFDSLIKIVNHHTLPHEHDEQDYLSQVFESMESNESNESKNNVSWDIIQRQCNINIDFLETILNKVFDCSCDNCDNCIFEVFEVFDAKQQLVWDQIWTIKWQCTLYLCKLLCIGDCIGVECNLNKCM